jgi:hypothetical protein
MGHGHFDRLAWLFYDNGNEVVPDYGAARFLNVESKYGGHYLPENNSFAKQSVAHSTLVVDETSQFGGDWRHGSKYHPEPLLFEAAPNLDIAAARMDGAYEGVSFERVLVLLKNGLFQNPVVLDVLRAEAEEAHQFDLPLNFSGHITNVSHPVDAATDAMAPLGGENGYQHLWMRAAAEVAQGELFQLTWLLGGRFYTHSSVTAAPAEYAAGWTFLHAQFGHRRAG